MKPGIAYAVHCKGHVNDGSPKWTIIVSEDEMVAGWLEDSSDADWAEGVYEIQVLPDPDKAPVMHDVSDVIAKHYCENFPEGHDFDDWPHPPFVEKFLEAVR